MADHIEEAAVAATEQSAAATSARGSLWRNRDFMLLWGGQTVSFLGSGVSELAMPLLILAISHSPTVAGLISGVGLLPYEGATRGDERKDEGATRMPAHPPFSLVAPFLPSPPRQAAARSSVWGPCSPSSPTPYPMHCQ